MRKSCLRIHVFTGPVDSGKTGELKRELKTLMERDYRIGGILSEAVMQGEVKTAYHAIDIVTGRRILLVSREIMDSDLRTGKYHFSHAGFEEASSALLNAMDREILVLDEIGPLELREEGYAEALRTISDSFQGLLLTVVRDYLLDDILRHFCLEDRVERVIRCPVSGPFAFEPWS